MTVLNQPWSCSWAAFQGWRSRKAGSASAISTKRRRMKSIWIGTGFSHHSVPSLSKTATRSSTGTGSDPSSPLVFPTNSRIACFVGPSRQLASALVAGDSFSVLTLVLIQLSLGRAGGTRSRRHQRAHNPQEREEDSDDEQDRV